MSEPTVRYAVEGLYVNRSKSNPNDPPEKWVREWCVWMECSSIDRLNAVLTNGLKLLNQFKDYSGFIDLRAVKITERRESISYAP